MNTYTGIPENEFKEVVNEIKAIPLINIDSILIKPLAKILQTKYLVPLDWGFDENTIWVVIGHLENIDMSLDDLEPGPQCVVDLKVGHIGGLVFKWETNEEMESFCNKLNKL